MKSAAHAPVRGYLCFWLVYGDNIIMITGI